MALGHGASIVRNGLVLHLDAANQKSYSGIGTTWNDLSGLGNHGSLVSGPVYNSSNLGNIIFDGTDDYVNITTSQITAATTITVEGFIKWISLNGGMFLGMSTYDVWTSGGTLGYNNGESNVIGISAATVSALGLVGNYKHYAFTMNSSGLLSTNKIHINGVQQSISAVVNNDGNIPGFNNSIRLASWNNGGFNGNVAYGNVRIYNRALSDTEIEKNFNALRGRYGV